MQTLREENERLTLQLTQLREKAKDLADNEPQEAIFKQELQTLREENERLTLQLTQLREKAKDLADNEPQEAIFKQESLKKQVEELHKYREKVIELELKVSEIPRMEDSIERLSAENTTLRSLELIHRPPPRLALSEKSEGFGPVLESFLKRLSQHIDCRGGVLADEQGLPVVSSSKYAEELAVVAAIFDELADNKIPAGLPFSTLQQFSLVDENSVTITAQPFPISSGQLILISLSVGAGPDKELINQLISQTPAVA
ncbi:MAG: hypothetical protein GY862_27980 [Gammaproteobacteria bacterium]|nr:hypothetical protein [Gammaproteobacteria bacterium]